MPRRARSPGSPESKSSRLSRIADKIKAWHVIAAAAVALIGAGWWAKARAGEFATRGELISMTAPLIEHVAKHDVDNARMDQKLDDVVATVHEIREQILRLK